MFGAEQIAWYTVHPMKYTYSSCFAMYYCSLVAVDCTHISQGYFTNNMGNHTNASEVTLNDIDNCFP